MKAYRIHIWQDDPDYLRGHAEDFDVRATSATVALKRALEMARSNGFIKSRPLCVKSLTELSSDLR